MHPAPIEDDVITLLDPPQPQDTQSGAQGVFQVLFPVLGTAGSMIFILANPRPVAVAAGLVFMMASVGVGLGMFLVQRGLPRRRLREDRARYLEYLEQVREQLRGARRNQMAAEGFRHPEPERLLDLASDTSRLWERRVDDTDFLSLRLGLGDVLPRLQVKRRGEQTPMDRADPVCVSAARQILDGQRILTDQPAAVDLGSMGVVSLCGDLDEARGVLRSVLAQAVTLHSADDLQLAFCFAPEGLPLWSWVKWLPHTITDHTYDGPVPTRLVASDLQELGDVLRPELESLLDRAARARGTGGRLSRRLVVVIDAERLPSHLGFDLGEVSVRPQDAGVTLVYVVGDKRLEPSTVDVRFTIERGGRALVEYPSSAEATGAVIQADRVSVPALSALARALCPIRVSQESAAESLAQDVDLFALLGVPDVADIDPRSQWRARTARQFLRVPLGMAASGLPLTLDLKESALGGMGPHGLVVGATGSGKSELLRTLVLALATTHDPERLAFVLVDYKGGATFAGMEPLPHVAGAITNLQEDLGLVDRMHDALYGEIRRRQRVLKEAGNLPNVHEYNRRRDQGEQLDPLPSLLLIVDEFSELLTAKPDFAELFVAIGRIGRSIGIHLLLASQRLETGRIRGLESHLSYRIGLKTFSPAESREAIGVPDAYELPPFPGSGFLRVDTTVFERFKVAQVSTPYESPAMKLPATPHPLPYTAYNGIGGLVDEHRDHEGAERAASGVPSVMDVVVERLRPAAGRVHQVWLPPLRQRFSLAAVTGTLEVDPERGLTAANGRGALQVPIGLIDRPQEQRIDVFRLDLAVAEGNIAIVGAPQTGKSTVIRSLVLGAAVTHTPRELSFYGIDFGGALAPLDALPNVGAIAGRSDSERAVRILGELSAVLAARELLFREHRIDSPAMLRRRFAEGKNYGQSAADIVLLLDNWGAIRTELTEAEELVTDIAARGLGYGIHVVVSAGRWTDIRPALQNALRGRLELRINDPFESRVDRKSQERISGAAPARGLTADKFVFQTALPRLDGGDDVADVGKALDDSIAAVAAAWAGPPARAVRILPAHVSAGELHPPGRNGSREVILGMSGVDLAPARLDLFGPDPHFLVLGDSQSGKSAALRTILRGLVDTRRPDELLIALFDYRRTLLDVVPNEYLLSYVGSSNAAPDVVADLANALENRLPGPDLDVTQLRSRSWWNGPEVLVVVDDYDLVATRQGNPLESLAPLLPQARDIGMHLVIGRRVSGIARSFDHVMQRLLEIGSPGLVLSGDRGEGAVLNGVVARVQPPGRGLLARRGRPSELVQVAWTDEPAAPGSG